MFETRCLVLRRVLFVLVAGGTMPACGSDDGLSEAAVGQWLTCTDSTCTGTEPSGLVFDREGHFVVLAEWRENPGIFCESFLGWGSYRLEGDTLTLIVGDEDGFDYRFLVASDRAELTVGERIVYLRREESLAIDGTCPREYSEDAGGGGLF